MTDGRNMELIVLSDVFKYTLKREDHTALEEQEGYIWSQAT